MAAIHLSAQAIPFIYYYEGEACMKDAGNGFLSDETQDCAIEHEKYVRNG